ncbi:hypothetical protein [Phenylobacterium sp.]|uniref:hypothetical protein n=1 Tax=Phenylobacterium sp. TaxID=1871053 RepID=UPI0035AEDB55
MPRNKQPPKPAYEIIARAFCSADPDEQDARGRCLWQSYEKYARRAEAALLKAGWNPPAEA